MKGVDTNGKEYQSNLNLHNSQTMSQTALVQYKYQSNLNLHNSQTRF